MGTSLKQSLSDISLVIGMISIFMTLSFKIFTSGYGDIEKGFNKQVGMNIGSNGWITRFSWITLKYAISIAIGMLGSALLKVNIIVYMIVILITSAMLIIYIIGITNEIVDEQNQLLGRKQKDRWKFHDLINSKKLEKGWILFIYILNIVVYGEAENNLEKVFYIGVVFILVLLIESAISYRNDLKRIESKLIVIKNKAYRGKILSIRDGLISIKFDKFNKIRSVKIDEIDQIIH